MPRQTAARAKKFLGRGPRRGYNISQGGTLVPQQPDTDALLEKVSQGDHVARDQLLARHRARLRKMVALRMDRRLARRVDPSDVVQEALAEAARRLPDYLRKR